MLILSNCGILSSGKNQATETNTSVLERALTDIDSFYLGECGWVKPVEKDVVVDYFESFQEAMTVLRDCHARHNPLVKDLKPKLKPP